MHLPSQILETQALITRCGDDWALGRVGLTLSCRFLPFLACFGVVGGCRFPSFPTCKLNPIIASPTESQPGQLRVRTQWVPPSQAATPIRPKFVLSLPSCKFRRPLDGSTRIRSAKRGPLHNKTGTPYARFLLIFFYNKSQNVFSLLEKTILILFF